MNGSNKNKNLKVETWVQFKALELVSVYGFNQLNWQVIRMVN